MTSDGTSGAAGDDPNTIGSWDSSGGDSSAKSLGAEDARAVDLLIEHGFDLDRALSAHPELAPRLSAAHALFARMDAVEVEPPDPALIDATLARIAREETARESRMRVGPGSDRALVGVSPSRWKDFVAVACVAIMLLAIGMPLSTWLRGRSIDARCSANMRTIAGALDTYTKDHGALPFAASLGADFASLLDWRGYQNSSHLSPLHEHQYCDPGCLCCAGAPEGAGYAFQVPSRMADWRWRGGERVPVLSDRNPIIDFERRGLRVASLVGNSPDHDGRGENMLFTDGSIEFVTTPVLLIPRRATGAARSPAPEHVWLPSTGTGEERLGAPGAWGGTDVFLLD